MLGQGDSTEVRAQALHTLNLFFFFSIPPPQPGFNPQHHVAAQALLGLALGNPEHCQGGLGHSQHHRA